MTLLEILWPMSGQSSFAAKSFASCVKVLHRAFAEFATELGEAKRHREWESNPRGELLSVFYRGDKVKKSVGQS